MAGKRTYDRCPGWTDEYLRELVEDRQSGRTLQEIGDDLGVTRERVRQLLLEAEIRGLWDGLPLRARPDNYRTPEAAAVLERAAAGADSFTEIAIETGVARTTVGKVLRRHAPELRSSCRKKYPVEVAGVEEIRRMYWDEGLSTVEIAARLDTHASCVQGFMERHGVPRRASNREASGLVAMGIDRVKKLHHIDGLTAREIGKMAGVSSSAVYQFLHRHGAGKRTRSA